MHVNNTVDIARTLVNANNQNRGVISMGSSGIGGIMYIAEMGNGNASVRVV